MLIRRDGLMAKPLPTGPNFEKLLSMKNSQAAEYIKQQRQVTQSEQLGQQRPVPLNSAMGQVIGASWPPQSRWDLMEQNVL